MYCGITNVPESYAVGNGSMMEFSFDAAFWVYNMVSNYAYTRYNVIHPEIRAEQTKLEWQFINDTKEIDKKAADLFTNDKEAAIKMLTYYSVKTGDETTRHWLKFYTYLFTKYMDGNIKEARDVPEGYKYVTPSLDQPGYSPEWYRKIVEETGDHFKVQGSAGH